ncbi:MAG: S1 RNA-binding domain-containing protein [Thermodesulfobacteriota bacterium]
MGPITDQKGIDMPTRKPDDSADDEMNDSQDPSEDFAALFEASLTEADAVLPRDREIQGTVVTIGSEWVFVDVGAKSEGAIAREELLDKNRELTVKVGDTIGAYVISTRAGEIMLSVKITGAASEEVIRGAHQSGVPVEGLVTEERKGGYGVKVFGKPAFCPYSQMDMTPGGSPSDYLDQKFLFRITEYSDRGRNIVLSRRRLLEEEHQKKLVALRESLKVGDVVRGTVKNLAKFGAFVDLGGIEGLVPMSELAWFRVAEASDVLHTGEEVAVKVIEIDWPKNRVSLSIKQCQDDPWSSTAERYAAGASLAGRRVTRLAAFGAFVELEPGIEGLIHISKLGEGRRINHPREVISEGDLVDVEVLSVDEAARRISLERIVVGALGFEVAEPVSVLPGSVLTGKVATIKEYGVFVDLPGNKSGLLHVSEIGEGRGGDLRKRFPVGSEIQVQVLAVDPASDKISLSLRTLADQKERSDARAFLTKSGSGSLGTLGDLLRDKLKG